MRFNFISQRGFTLVEVLTVMLVLVAIASITVESTKDFVFQGRYDITKDRYEKIKKAIIGDPNQVINGQPNISGFVADMGRLPRNLHELLVQNYCDNDYRISDNTPDSSGITGATGATPKEWCESKTPVGIWIRQNCSDDTQPDKPSCDAAGKIWREWKGGYVETTQPDYKPNALPDGWGNSASTTDFTDQNYGWYFATDSFYLSLQSKGKNGNRNPTDTGYDEDYPKAASLPSIKHGDWTVDINTFKLLINASYNGSCSAATCSDPLYKTQASCETPRAVWTSGSPGSCSNTFYTTQAECETLRGTWANHKSKANCEAGGAQWTQLQKNLKLKINSVESNDSPLITEDGRENLLSFNFTNHVIAMGQVNIGVYYALDTTLTYPSLCTNKNDDAAFTQPTCETNGGTWKTDATEQYCYGLTTTNVCTVTLKGDVINKEEKKLTLYPNTTLPTINW